MFASTKDETADVVDQSERGPRPIPISFSVRLWACLATLNTFRNIFDLGTSAVAGPLIQESLKLTDYDLEIYMGILNLFAVVGAFTQQYLSDVYGRRLALATACIFNIIGQVIILSATKSFPQILVGRAFIGTAYGLSLMLDATYISELSPAKHRGYLVTWGQLAATYGLLAGYAVKLLILQFPPSPHSWRLVCIISMIISFSLLLSVAFVLPESPRWLVLNNMMGEARAVLYKIYPKGFNVNLLINDILLAAEREFMTNNTIGWGEILAPTPALRLSLLLGWGTAVLVQATGVEPIWYYVLSILEAANITDELQQSYILVGLGFTMLVCTVIGGYLIDIQGRRQLLLISLFGMVFSNVMIALSFIVRISWRPTFVIVGLGSYFILYGYGLGPIAYVLPPELFPTFVRAKAMGVMTIIHGGSATILVSSFLTVADVITWPGCFFIFAACSFIAGILYYVYLPETNGFMLEEVLLVLAKQTGDFSVLAAEEELTERNDETSDRISMMEDTSENVTMAEPSETRSVGWSSRGSIAWTSSRGTRSRSRGTRKVEEPP